MAYENHNYGETLADYVLQLFKEFGENRQEKQLKWERNREAFLADGSNLWKVKDLKAWEEQTFIHLTKQKVIAGFSLVMDVMMQGGKIPYHFKFSPFAEQAIEDLPEDAEELQRDNLKAAKDLTDQQLQMTRSDRAFVKNILSATLYGETCAQFFVKPIQRKRRASVAFDDALTDYSAADGDHVAFETQTVTQDMPAWDYFSVWDFFYDMEGGVHDGCGCFRRLLVNNHWLRTRIGKEGFFELNIKDLLREGGSESTNFTLDETTLAPSLRNLKHRKNNRQYLMFFGRVPKKRVEAFFKDLKDNAGREFATSVSEIEQDDALGEEVECCIHVCDDKVIFFDYTEASDRPFEHTYWEDPLDELAGQGIADNVDDMQALLNEVFHDYKRNKKQAGSVKGAIKRRMFDVDVKEEDFEKPGKMLDISEECDDARRAWQQIVVQDVGSSFQPLLQMIVDFADEDSMIARIMQGGEPQGDVTARQIIEQTEKGGKYIATVVQNLDERLIEPMMNRFFDYNMDDPAVSRGRGDYVAEALGFTSFMDRQVRLRYLTMLLDYILSTESLAKKYAPEAMFEEIAKSVDVSIKQFERGEEELAAMNQPDPMRELEMQKSQIQIERDQSAIELNRVRAEQVSGDGLIKRAKLAEEIMQRRGGVAPQ